MDAFQPHHALHGVVLDATPAAIVVSDAQGRIVLVNRQVERLFGFQRDELLGQSIENLVPERLRTGHAAARAHFDARPAVRAMGKGRDLLGLRKDGVEFPVEIGLNPLVTDSGPLVVSAIIDITERKRAEAALREADRCKDEFLAMLAHELRNPLAPLCNALGILRNFDVQGDEARALFDMMERQSQVLKRLVDELLDASRITTGKIELHKAPLQVGQLVGAALDAIRPLCEERGHRLIVTPPSRPAWIVGDEVRLVQALSNLLDNAAKYTPPGGEVRVSTELEDGRVLIRISDTGTGIDPELLPRMFELFMQGDRTPDRSVGGLGVGLTVARRLIELHGGTLDGHSPGLGAGSSFSVSLSAGPPPMQAQLSRKAEGAAVSLSLLVVDDNRDAADSLALLLQVLGHRVRCAYHGEEALDVLGRQRFDAVLLDIGMPDMDGYEVSRRIRSELPGSRPILVAVTGYGRPQDLQTAKEAGFDQHLLKPVGIEVLRRVLEAVAQRASSGCAPGAGTAMIGM